MDKNRWYRGTLTVLAMSVAFGLMAYEWTHQSAYAQDNSPQPPDAVRGHYGPPVPPIPAAPAEPPAPADAVRGFDGPPPPPEAFRGQDSPSWTPEAFRGQAGPPPPPEGFRGQNGPPQPPDAFRGQDSPPPAPEAFRGQDGPPRPPRGYDRGFDWAGPQWRGGDLAGQEYARRFGPPRRFQEPGGQRPGPHGGFDGARAQQPGPFYGWNGPQGEGYGAGPVPQGRPGRPQPPDIDALFRQVDANGDGMISREEVYAFLDRQCLPRPPIEQRSDKWKAYPPPINERPGDWKPEPPERPVPPPVPGNAR